MSKWTPQNPIVLSLNFLVRSFWFIKQSYQAIIMQSTISWFTSQSVGPVHQFVGPFVGP